MDLSKLPPEQRAKVEEAMKGMMGAHTNVTKSCITKEKLEKNVFMMEPQEGQKCTQTITSNTRSTLEAALTCTGQRPMTGTLHIDAISSTQVKGLVTAAVVNNGRPMNVTTQIAGKWISADCGAEK
jgi:hypothetical protein